MPSYLLQSTQKFRQPLADVFPFFADAANLEQITPPWLRFKILTPNAGQMRRGAKIDYRLRVNGVPVRWQSEITAWEPPFRFVDEQRSGPYREWVHEHKFVESSDGCEMTDTVRYQVPGGALVNFCLVSRQLRRIFEYRSHFLAQRFECDAGAGSGVQITRA
ncbi:MAG: SRPBCC family protein [Planctomycetota bacterium]